jgi:MFS family permease
MANTEAAVKTTDPGKQKLNYPKTILTGCGFLGVMIAWQIYSPYISKLLDKLLGASPTVAGWSEKLAGSTFLAQFMASQGSNAFLAGRFTVAPLLIGLIMTLHNVFGVVFQPLFGKVSDQCHSRFGKRKPFIVACAPVSAALFFLFPFMPNLPMLLLWVVLFSFVMSIWRAPVIALMPDLTPPQLRSEGNAIISLMGGIGAAIGLGAGSVVKALLSRGAPPDQFDEFRTFPPVFALGAVVMVLGMLVVALFVKEKDSRLLGANVLAGDQAARRAAEKKALALEKQLRKTEKLSHAERRSLLVMLAALFFLCCGNSTIQTFFALFAQEILHKDTAAATFLMLIFALCAMGGALPAGWLGRRLGRRKTILLGLAMFLGAFALFFVLFLVLRGVTGLSIGEYVRRNAENPLDPAVVKTAGFLGAFTIPVLIFAGAASMFINVNTLPLVLEIGGVKKVGTFTGYYYAATFSANIASPILYGVYRMFSGTYLSLFYFCPFAFALALAFIFFVKHGEAPKQEAGDRAQAAS